MRLHGIHVVSITIPLVWAECQNIKLLLFWQLFSISVYMCRYVHILCLRVEARGQTRVSFMRTYLHYFCYRISLGTWNSHIRQKWLVSNCHHFWFFPIPQIWNKKQVSLCLELKKKTHKTQTKNQKTEMLGSKSGSQVCMIITSLTKSFPGPLKQFFDVEKLLLSQRPNRSAQTKWKKKILQKHN